MPFGNNDRKPGDTNFGILISLIDSLADYAKLPGKKTRDQAVFEPALQKIATTTQTSGDLMHSSYSASAPPPVGIYAYCGPTLGRPSFEECMDASIDFPVSGSVRFDPEKVHPAIRVP